MRREDNMKPDEFEKRLQRQPLRQVPTAWREEVLTAAGRALPVGRRAPRPVQLTSLVSRLSAALWPHPAAWAGLVAVWVFIFAVDFSIRDRMPGVVVKTAPPEPEVIAELRQQRRLLAELIGPRDARDAGRSKPLAPQPRSERRFEALTV